GRAPLRPAPSRGGERDVANYLSCPCPWPETFLSVLVAFATSHSIVTTSTTFSGETSFCRFAGTPHVTPATLIEPVDPVETAVMAPWAFTRSGFGGVGGWQPPEVIRTASPAAVPPSLPFA